ncbi:MAG: ATP-binding cassette domain-containing protein [Firmicutes bacterium]|nr:ATP-binding cassette domain-containing protein [Bacillota bacterium]
MSEKTNEPILRVEHLCMYFGKGEGLKKAVDDVSFDIQKGEVFGLVGESGCGKTTTGRTMIRLYDATSGNVYFKGKRIVAGTLSYKNEIKELKDKIAGKAKNGDQVIKLSESEIQEANKRIAELRQMIKDAKHDHKDARKNGNVTQIQMIYQDPVASLDPRMTVKEIIAEGLRIQGVKDKEYIDQKVYEMLRTVGLVEEHATRYPHEFSGGQRQRIGIARSIIMNPEVIIADEPISALDVSIRAQVINLLNELRETMGLTILFIAHDLSVVKYFSDRIGVMYFGNMVEMATSDELFAHPLHPYTRSLLSAIPLPDPESEKGRVRIRYNPLTDHEYSTETPEFREIVPGHFVRCTSKEFEKYKAEYDK